MSVVTRRQFAGIALTGMAACLLGASPSQAQQLDAGEMVRLLRDGPGAATPSARRRRSALPARPLAVEAGDRRPRIVRIDPGRSVDVTVRFGFDSDVLTATAREDLAWLGRALGDELRDRSFLLAGHTDSRGSAAHNVDLSLRRARSVWRYLVEDWGADPARLFVQGYGPRHPADPARPSSPINRRVEVVAIASGTD